MKIYDNYFKMSDLNLNGWPVNKFASFYIPI